MSAFDKLCDREGYKKRKADPVIEVKKKPEPKKVEPKSAPVKKVKSLKGDK